MYYSFNSCISESCLVLDWGDERVLKVRTIWLVLQQVVMMFSARIASTSHFGFHLFRHFLNLHHNPDLDLRHSCTFGKSWFILRLEPVFDSLTIHVVLQHQSIPCFLPHPRQQLYPVQILVGCSFISSIHSFLPCRQFPDWIGYCEPHSYILLPPLSGFAISYVFHTSCFSRLLFLLKLLGHSCTFYKALTWIFFLTRYAPFGFVLSSI